jgi:hypothetical protein
MLGPLGSVCDRLTHILRIGSTVANREPKPASSRIQWERGKPLSFAWWDFATKEGRREYQTCKLDSRRMSYRLDMKFDVLDELVAGKLIAFGFRDGAALEEGPVPIPAHLFPRGGEDTAVVDWDLSTLRSSGFSFTRIQVSKPQAGTRRKKPTSAAKSEQTRRPPASSITASPRPVVSERPKKMGRPPVGEQLRAVIRLLVGSGELKDKSRKAQIEIIRAAARAAHPELFLTENRPSRDKIFSALRAEGLVGPRE